MSTKVISRASEKSIEATIMSHFSLVSQNKKQRLQQLFEGPIILYGRAARFILGTGRTTRGRHVQTERSPCSSCSTQTTSEDTPDFPGPLNECRQALDASNIVLTQLERSHRERWVQHYIYMRKSTVWEQMKRKRLQKLRQAIERVRINLPATTSARFSSEATPPALQSPSMTSQSPQLSSPLLQGSLPASSTLPPTFPEDDHVCLTDVQLDAWVNQVLSEFHHVE